MKARRSMVWTAAVALLLAGFLGAGTANAENQPNSDKVSKMLQDAKAMAVQVQQDAATMQSYTQLGMKWEAHGTALAEIRKHLMALNEKIPRLKAALSTAEPWQQNVITRIEPLMTALVSDNESLIDEIDAHPSLFGTPAWNAYVTANASSSANLAALISNFIDNGMLREKMQEHEETC